MTWQQALGAAFVAIPTLILVGGTVATMGWRDTLFIFGSSIGLSGLFVGGIYLLTGQI